MPNEIVWNFDKRFKRLLDKISFEVYLKQHKQWIIITLLPHIHQTLLQQALTTQTSAMELAMKLEASLIVDTSSCMAQVQSQLQALTLQLQGIKKGKEKCKGVWCTTCNT